MTEQKPMTYREIRDYLEEHYITLADDELGPICYGVFRWLTHEVMPDIAKTDHYEFPSDLDLICPHTNELKTGRYATEPIK